MLDMVLRKVFQLVFLLGVRRRNRSFSGGLSGAQVCLSWVASLHISLLLSVCYLA